MCRRAAQVIGKSLLWTPGTSRGVIPVIGVKEAAEKAAEYFTDLYHDQFTNVLLEETERKADRTGHYWLITLGYDRPSSLPQFARKGPRAFKIFRVNAETGEVVSMRIREVEHVE